MSELAVEKAKTKAQGKAIQQPTQPYLPRTNFRWTDPTGFTADQWRLIAREPVNQMAQRFIQRELTALEWEVVSDRKDDKRIENYTKAWQDVFDGGQGFGPWLSRIMADVFTVPFGGASEVGYKGKELAFCNHVDAATLLPTYLPEVPYVQVNPDNWEQRVYFKPDDLARLMPNARGEIRWKEYQRAPTEEAFMIIEALSKIYLYSMQELTDTPSMGILDMADMTKGEAKEWAKGFQELLKGIDPFKIPILYDHEKPANWIPFNRGPEELGLNEQFRRYAEMALGFYGLSIGDLRLFERQSTKAGERVSQMVTERSGVGYWAAIVADYLTRLLPEGLKFRFKQPRPERDKVVAERKAAQLASLQAATGNKPLIEVEDAIEEAKALDLFTTEVTAAEPEPMPAMIPGQPPGAPAGEDFGDKTREEIDQDSDKDLSKADLTALEVKAAVIKALGPAWRHPEPQAQERLRDALQAAFTQVGDRVPADQVAPILEYVQRTLDALENEEPDPKGEPPSEKGGPGSGNWSHGGRPEQRGGSAPGGGLAKIGAKRGHTAAERQAMSRRQRQQQGTWVVRPTAAGIRGTIRARQRAQAAAMGRRQEQQANQAIGGTTEAFGQDPTNRYEFRNRVVSLDSLVTSNKPSGEVNPDYDPNLQPRERSRAASEMQIDNMARNMQPEALTWDFHQLDKGAPIVWEDRMVESGNGRILALQKARDAYPEQWANYQKTMEAQLEAAGIDPAKVKGIRDPVLIRERVTPVDRAEFAREANSAGVLQMSPLEKARNDARIISDQSLTNFVVGEDQSIDQALRAPANRAFVRNFVGSLPPNEAAALQRADGSLNRMGLWRVKAGMFSKTFPGESGDRLADTFFESVDHTTRNFENAIGDALPRLARVEGLIASGQRAPHLSLSNDITAAIDMHARLKETGVSARNYVAQTSMFGRELTSSQESLLVHFSDNSRSRKTIRETLIRYADAVERQPDPRQGAMFGGGSITAEDLLAQVVKEEKGLTAVMGILGRRLEKAGIIKAQPLTNVVEARVHEAFTVALDRALQLGLITRDARIEASSVIGDMLPELTKKTPAERGPVDPDSLVAALFWDRLAPPDPIDQPQQAQPAEKGEEPDPLETLITDVTGHVLAELEKGGPGSGNWRHAGRPGQRGRSAPGGGSRKVGTTQVGITSHRAGRTPAQAKAAGQEWEKDLKATSAKNPKVQLGIGGYEGSREPTYVTTYEGNGEALKAAARFGKKYEQDAVIVQKFVGKNAPGAQPMDELSFNQALSTPQIRAVEKVMVSEGIGGWTWSQGGNGNTRLQMTFIPDWADYDQAGHSTKVARVGEYMNGAGTSVNRVTDWVKTTIMYGDTYDSYTSGESKALVEKKSPPAGARGPMLTEPGG